MIYGDLGAPWASFLGSSARSCAKANDNYGAKHSPPSSLLVAPKGEMLGFNIPYDIDISIALLNSICYAADCETLELF